MPSRYLQRNACLADVPRLVELLIRMDAHVAGVPRARLQLTVAGRQDLHNRFENLIDDPDATVVVATQRGRIVAMGNLQIWRYPDFWRNRERRGRSVAVIDDVWVEPRHRRRGLSRDIVRDLVAFAAIHNVENLMLEYSLSNPEAEGAWTKLGFRPTGVRAESTVAEVGARLQPDSAGETS